MRQNEINTMEKFKKLEGIFNKCFLISIDEEKNAIFFAGTPLNLIFNQTLKIREFDSWTFTPTNLSINLYRVVCAVVTAQQYAINFPRGMNLEDKIESMVKVLEKEISAKIIPGFQMSKKIVFDHSTEELLENLKF